MRELDVPVYGTCTALALAAERLKEDGLLEKARLVPVEPRRASTIGPFRVEPIRVTHSSCDGVGYAIETPVGTVFHSGDFKLDPTPSTTSARLPPDGGDGRSAASSASWRTPPTWTAPAPLPLEREVGLLYERFRKAPGRIIVATFASHVHRIQQLLDVANAFGRRVALLGRSMETNVRIAVELGLLRDPGGLRAAARGRAALPPSQVILSTGARASRTPPWR